MLSKRSAFIFVSLSLLCFGGAARAFAAEVSPTDADVHRMLQTIDERQRNGGDYKASVILKHQDGKNLVVYDVVVYRRDKDEKLMILFLRPESDAGKGYLRSERNLFLYDASIGKWD